MIPAKGVQHLVLVMILTFLHPAFSTTPVNLQEKSCPLWWKIKIRLVTKGNYRVREGNSEYLGYYTYTFLCKGSMERDEDDYLLYPDNSKLIDWEIQETAIFEDSIQTLTTSNITVKPSIKLNYILKKGDNLYFDIKVESFLVPQNESLHKFYLDLPVSAENSQHPSDIDYDTYVKLGSNNIKLKENPIHRDIVKKKFWWNWHYEKWKPVQNKTVFFNNKHEVLTEVTIIPQYK